MKRLLVFGLSLGLVAVLAAPAAANNVETYKLYASKNVDIGTVQIGTAGDGDVEVKVIIDEAGWCMTELHIDQAGAKAGIDQNKANNPQVGKFEVNESFDGCRTSFGFVELSGDGPWVAVHAKVYEIIKAGPSWATVVVDDNQGLRKNGTPVLANRSTAASGLVKSGEFFSLGFGGDITARFSCTVLDRPGPDLLIWEVTNGRNSYPVELAEVKVGLENSGLTSLGNASNKPGDGNGSTYFDVGQLFKFVKLTDSTNPALYDTRPDADGFDLDGIKALQDCVKFASAWGAESVGSQDLGGSSWATVIEYDPTD